MSNAAGAPGNESRCEDCRKPITRGRQRCRHCSNVYARRFPHREPTLEELEAMIEERRPTMPPATHRRTKKNTSPRGHAHDSDD